MSHSLKDVLKDSGYSDVDAAKIIALNNQAERDGIPYPFYYALSKFILGIT